jgi:hypothetical protein
LKVGKYQLMLKRQAGKRREAEEVPELLLLIIMMKMNHCKSLQMYHMGSC